MRILKISRLEAHIEAIVEDEDSGDSFKNYCVKKLKEAGFDLSKDIEYTDECHTITFTQEV